MLFNAPSEAEIEKYSSYVEELWKLRKRKVDQQQ